CPQWAWTLPSCPASSTSWKNATSSRAVSPVTGLPSPNTARGRTCARQTAVWAAHPNPRSRMRRDAMLSITGHTPTDRAARYMKQLVSHLGRKLETSTQDASATVTMGDASAALTATASELTITVSAAEEATLFRL